MAYTVATRRLFTHRAGAIDSTNQIGWPLNAEARRIFKTILAFRIRPVTNWGWVMFSGIVTFFLGVVIWAGWPFSAVWMVGFMFGIDMLFGGGSLIMVAMSARRGLKALEERAVDCNLHPELY